MQPSSQGLTPFPPGSSVIKPYLCNGGLERFDIVVELALSFPGSLSDASLQAFASIFSEHYLSQTRVVFHPLRDLSFSFTVGKRSVNGRKSSDILQSEPEEQLGSSPREGSSLQVERQQG